MGGIRLTEADLSLVFAFAREMAAKSSSGNKTLIVIQRAIVFLSLFIGASFSLFIFSAFHRSCKLNHVLAAMSLSRAKSVQIFL